MAAGGGSTLVMYGQLFRHNGLLGLISNRKIRQIRDFCSIALFPPDRSPQPKPHYCTKHTFGKSCTMQHCARDRLKKGFYGPADPSHSGARLPTQYALPFFDPTSSQGVILKRGSFPLTTYTSSNNRLVGSATNADWAALRSMRHLAFHKKNACSFTLL